MPPTSAPHHEHHVVATLEKFRSVPVSKEVAAGWYEHSERGFLTDAADSVQELRESAEHLP
jgi:hypothetical protein